MKTIGDIGEDALIATLCQNLTTSPNLIIGPGDDCAVIASHSPSSKNQDEQFLTLLKTDAVVAGIHFLPTEEARRVGWKSIARVLSDFAAMGGRPGELLVTIALAPSVTLAWVRELYAGMEACLKEHGGIIAGGETSSLPEGAPTVISIAGRGLVKSSQLVTRSGGQIGDSIYVTGTLGGSIHGKHLDFTPRIPEAAWLTQHFKINAMMDLSDGLAKDLPRLASKSRCGFQLHHQSLPLSDRSSIPQALNDGEDYELLFTSPDSILEPWKSEFPKLPLTKIGELTAEENSALSGGWDHFSR